MEEFFLKSKKTAGHYRIKRKLDEKLKKLEIPTISREKVKLITAKLCLVSKYIKRKRKNPDNVVGVNNNDTQNLLDLKFNHYKPMQAIVSDTTYFKIYIHNKKKFVYGCIVMDLWNREIIGFSTFTEKKIRI